MGSRAGARSRTAMGGLSRGHRGGEEAQFPTTTHPQARHGGACSPPHICAWGGCGLLAMGLGLSALLPLPPEPHASCMFPAHPEGVEAGHLPSNLWAFWGGGGGDRSMKKKKRSYIISFHNLQGDFTVSLNLIPLLLAVATVQKNKNMLQVHA